MTCPYHADDDALGEHPGSFLVTARRARWFVRDVLDTEPPESPQLWTLRLLLDQLDGHDAVLVRLVPLDLGPTATALDLLEAELRAMPAQEN